jgi:hypothetical protein
MPIPRRQFISHEVLFVNECTGRNTAHLTLNNNQSIVSNLLR